MKKYKFHAGTYDINYCLIIGDKPEEVNKFVTKHFNDFFDTDFSCASGLFFSRKGYIPVIWIPKNPKKAEEFSNLNHEILHLVIYILCEWTGIRLNEGSEEAFTHLMGKISLDIFKKLL